MRRKTDPFWESPTSLSPNRRRKSKKGHHAGKKIGAETLPLFCFRDFAFCCSFFLHGSGFPNDLNLQLNWPDIFKPFYKFVIFISSLKFNILSLNKKKKKSDVHLLRPADFTQHFRNQFTNKRRGDARRAAILLFRFQRKEIWSINALYQPVNWYLLI